MSKVHYSPKLKRMSVCRGKCRFGENTPHFGSMKEGNAWLRVKTAKENADLIVPSPTRKRDADTLNENLSRPRVRNEKSWLANSYEDEFGIVSTELDSELGMQITEHKGSLVEIGTLGRFSFSGKPDWSKLDEESYTKFGFAAYSSENLYYTTGNIAEKAKKRGAFEVSSERELAPLDAEGRRVLYSYSCDEYISINEYLDAASLGIDNEDDEEVEPYDIKNDSCRVLDRAFEKTATGEQRMVYRGVKLRNLGLSRDDFKLGSEIEFAGYQSSSVERIVAAGFANRDDGAILEISTPNGIHIESESDDPEEHEVLLHRNSRYVVVGVHEVKTNGMPNPVYQMVAVNSKGELLDGTNSDEPPPLERD